MLMMMMMMIVMMMRTARIVVIIVIVMMVFSHGKCQDNANGYHNGKHYNDCTIFGAGRF